MVLAQAARAIAAVSSGGQSADEALAAASDRGPDQTLQPAIRAVTLGTLRWYWRLTALSSLLLADRTLASVVSALLLAALHQLEYSRNPPEATVCSAVDAVRLVRQPRAAGLMNALLRRFLRERPALLARLLSDPVASSAHPAWLLAALRQAWPADWPRIVEANNTQAPLTLRVDLTRCSLERYREQLDASGLRSAALPGVPAAVVLDHPVAVAELPGFAAGLVSVQDAGAQLAAALLQVQPRERVLDACAAPGGKTGALLEAVDGALELTAIDSDARRLARVTENLTRLKRHARLVVADLCCDLTWWDGRPFDRILLDAPCSAVGVIRRHPDIKLLRRSEDIEALALKQRRLLEQCLRLLKPGGRLLYSTCSVLPAENERVIEAVVAAMPSARVLPPQALAWLPPDARQCRHGVQLLPGNAALTDGFYYACLTVA